MDGLGVGQFGDARLEKGGAFSAAHGRAIDGAAEAIGLPSRRGSQVRPFSAQCSGECGGTQPGCWRAGRSACPRLPSCPGDPGHHRTQFSAPCRAHAWAGPGRQWHRPGAVSAPAAGDRGGRRALSRVGLGQAVGAPREDPDGTPPAAERVLGAAELVTVVSDREADIYESWARPRPANLHLLARAAQNRSLVSGQLLFAECDRLAVGFCYEFEVPRQPGRPARRARMEVRFGKVELMRPRWLRRSPRTRGPTPDSVVLHVVDVRECGARSSQEPSPLHWRLLTTHAVKTPEDALDIVQWYRQRWNIEQLFWTLKRQGLDIEASQ